MKELNPMLTKFRGLAYTFGANIDTDQIYPGRFVELSEPLDIAPHAMEGADPAFAQAFKAGGILIGGRNFGCGSSREHAAIALKTIGVSAVVAESFGRIFYRNGINLGLLLLVCPGISGMVTQGDELELDLAESRIVNLATRVTTAVEPLSDYVLEILSHGGIKPLLRQRMLSSGQGLQSPVQGSQSTGQGPQSTGQGPQSTGQGPQ
jgi:3-isopropylmalate/(R)-2-methylmalate dehydratase small subunit